MTTLRNAAILFLTTTLGLISLLAATAQPVSAATGTAPLAFPQTNGVVLDGVMMYLPQQVLVIGGNFSSVTEPGGRVVAARNLAAIDVGTNKVIYSGNVNSSVAFVRKVETDSSKIYIGGNFTAINGVARPHIAQLNAATRSLTSWKPATDIGVVSAIAVSSQAVYYASGSRVVAVTPANAATIWSLPVTGGGVRDLLLSPDTTGLYVAGLFETVGGLPRHGLAAIYPALSGTPVASFNANLRPDSDALSSTWNGEEGLRIDWDYTNGPVRGILGFGGGYKNGVLSFEPSQGGTFWKTETEGDVQGLAVSGSTIYAGWHRNHGNQLPAPGGGILDYDIFGGSFRTVDGSLDTWKPHLTGDLSPNTAGDNGGIQGVVVTPTRVYFLGDFTTYGAVCVYDTGASHGYTCTGGTPRKGIAVFTL